MRIRFVHEARVEFLDGISYYESNNLIWVVDSKSRLSKLYFGWLNMQKSVD
ncbi:MAG TPA: hypothetical protein VIF64_04675 [Pyrinomonadaceae bacterium]|jgi:two-component SAPR family response regulator